MIIYYTLKSLGYSNGIHETSKTKIRCFVLVMKLITQDKTFKQVTYIIHTKLINDYVQNSREECDSAQLTTNCLELLLAFRFQIGFDRLSKILPSYGIFLELLSSFFSSCGRCLRKTVSSTSPAFRLLSFSRRRVNSTLHSFALSSAVDRVALTSFSV